MLSRTLSLTGSLLSPRQRHWASAGFGWCGALCANHRGVSTSVRPSSGASPPKAGPRPPPARARLLTIGRESFPSGRGFWRCYADRKGPRSRASRKSRAGSRTRTRALGACSAICWHSAARSLHRSGISMATPTKRRFPLTPRRTRATVAWAFSMHSACRPIHARDSGEPL